MLLGRDSELEAIDQLVDGVRAATGRALVIEGAPGIGKTALLEYAAGQAGPGMRVLRVVGAEGEAEMPYSALHLLLRPALGGVDALPGPQAAALRGAFGMGPADGVEPFLVGLATLTLLSEFATERPLLCLIDDGHCVDAASGQVVRFMARRIDHDPIGILVSTRQGGCPLATDWPSLRLGGLHADAATALLAREASGLPPHLRQRVLDTAEGNPLALLELPTTIGEDGASGTDPLPVSDRLRRAFRWRVDRLGEAAQALLVVVAAEGTGDLGAVLRAADDLALPKTALAEAERAGLVVVTAGSVRFRHPLMRTAAYQEIPFTQRQAVHRTLAGILEHSDPNRWAWHLAAATYAPDERVAAALERTAAHAALRNGQDAAVRAYTRAAALSEDDRARAGRLVLAGAAALEAAMFARAEELCESAAGLTDELVVLARVAGIRGALAFERGAPRAAARITIDGAAKLAAEDAAEAAKLLVVAAYYAGHGVDPQLTGEAIGLLNDLGLSPDHEFEPYMRQARGFYQVITGRDVDQAMFTALRPSSVWEQTWTARVLNIAGHAEAALEVATDMVATTRATGTIKQLTNALFHQACAEARLGRHQVAAGTAGSALTIADEMGQTSVASYLRGLLAWLAALTGDDERCRTLAAQAIRYADDHGTPPSAADATWALALLDLGHGRYEPALSRMENRWPFWPCSSTWIRSTADHLEAALRAGEPGVAARLMDELERHAGRLVDPGAPALLDRCRALAGPADKAEPHFLAALRPGPSDARPYDRARTLLAYGQWLRREHRKADARASLRAAIELFERTGARLWSDRARAELRATGDRSVRAAPGPAARLTPQELQVIRLAATGATNRDIGARLFLSPRTVAQHLYRVFPKLGITTRTELANLDLDPWS